MRSSKDGVAIVPGQIALQRMPWAIKSAATDLVSPITAALVALYTARFGTPFTEEAVDAMLTIEAPPPPCAACSSIFGRNARIIRYIERTLRAKEKSQSSGNTSSTVP